MSFSERVSELDQLHSSSRMKRVCNTSASPQGEGVKYNDYYKLALDRVHNSRRPRGRLLFRDLLRLPILHHYVWSEITGHNSLQRQR